MSKKPSGFSLFLLELVLPAFLRYGKDATKVELQKAYNESEKGKTLITTAITAAYPAIDVYLETAASGSKTQIDDKAVAELKALCEEFAADNGFELQNLDND